MTETSAHNNAKKVFISYSHSDKDWVRGWLLPRLEDAGITVHIDFRDFEIGPPVLLNIERAVEECLKTIVVLTPDWVQRDYTNFEGVMLQTRDPLNIHKRIMPLVLVECDLPRRLEILTWADFRREQDRETEFERLVGQIRRDLGIVSHDEVAVDKPPSLSRPVHVNRILPRCVIEYSPVVNVGRLPDTGYTLFGRQREFGILDDAWQSDETNVVTLVAYGGTGKSTLVNKWLEKLRWDNYRGARRVFGWSFYSQGTGQRVTSADAFVSEALKWFGDPEMAQSAASAWDKGQRLADLVRREKTLLVLDGMEPLQTGSDFEKGKIKDPALAELVKQLAKQNNGLCVITTREKVAELERFETGVMQIDLEQISKEAGRALLRVGGVRGTDDELEAASEAFDNHALAVSLLATYLHGIEGHHVANAASIPNLPSVSEEAGKHPRRVIEAFARRFADGPQTQVLRIMGLFDRPPEMALIDAVKADDPIAGLTDKLVDLSETQWHDVLDELRACHLLARKSEHNPDVLDCYPLIREHFADKLKNDHPEAWQEGHKRLYEYLTETTPDKPNAKLEDLQPLYQAVAHGCLAGMYEEARAKVYRDRIQRGNEFYSADRLGAFGSDLGAVAHFFEQPWGRVSGRFSEADRAWLFNEAATRLRALGRLTEGLEPMRAALDIVVHLEAWKRAAVMAANLAELDLALGRVAEGLEEAKMSAEYAGRSGDTFQQILRYATRGNTLFQAGQVNEATRLFQQAEEMQAKKQPQYPLLYSLQGFWWCDLLLVSAERATWQAVLNPQSASPSQQSQETCDTVEQRARQTLEWAKTRRSLQDIALNSLSLGRAGLYRGILAKSGIRDAESQVEEAVLGLRCASQVQEVPLGLLSRAMLRFVEGDEVGCRADLDEAWEIAERGLMKLHMADVYLHRARLFRDKAELAQARALIEECGYGRRKGELEDAEKAAENW